MASTYIPSVETLRHAAAVLALISYPAGLVFWVIVHRFIVRWRTIGPTRTYIALCAALMLVGWGLFLWRDPLIGRDLGTSRALVVLATGVLIVGLDIERRCRRMLSLRTLAGVPELKAETNGVLLREGIFARVRHPRYLGASLGLMAIALFANHLGTYLLVLVFLPGIYLVTVLEERELVARFGDRYRDYQRQVPRLLPRPVLRTTEGQH
jgi:protein-S-isoprenylcysteine O-methyltransferase Ste14